MFVVIDITWHSALLSLLPSVKLSFFFILVMDEEDDTAPTESTQNDVHQPTQSPSAVSDASLEAGDSLPLPQNSRMPKCVEIFYDKDQHFTFWTEYQILCFLSLLKVAKSN